MALRALTLLRSPVIVIRRAGCGGASGNLRRACVSLRQYRCERDAGAGDLVTRRVGERKGSRQRD